MNVIHYQLAPLLNPSNIKDILAVPSMLLHCANVVRAYFESAEDDSPYNFITIVNFVVVVVGVYAPSGVRIWWWCGVRVFGCLLF